MLLSITILLLMFEAESHAPVWWNYPGLELWKFINLFIFAGGLIYFLKPSLAKAFQARRESIKTELIKAQEERDQALAKLAEVQSRLERLDVEVVAIQNQSRAEAEAERERIARETELESAKLREQAKREIIGAGKVARNELRRFAAQQSVKLAEEMIRRDIRPEDDARLISRNVEQLGRDGR